VSKEIKLSLCVGILVMLFVGVFLLVRDQDRRLGERSTVADAESVRETPSGRWSLSPFFERSAGTDAERSTIQRHPPGEVVRAITSEEPPRREEFAVTREPARRVIRPRATPPPMPEPDTGLIDIRRHQAAAQRRATPLVPASRDSQRADRAPVVPARDSGLLPIDALVGHLNDALQSKDNPRAVPRSKSQHRTYTVQRTDTLWRISAKFYGDGRLWRKIREANREKFPGNATRLHPGWVLRIPNLSVVASADESAPAAPRAVASTYTVARNDTLRVIADRVYGSTSKWRAIWRANRAQVPDPNRLRVGQVLALP